MRKAPNFVYEYATFQINNYSLNELMREDIKLSALRCIRRIIQLYERGDTTIDETMKMLVSPLPVDADGKVIIQEH